MRKVPYPTPGEILLEEFLKPMGITQYWLAKEIAVPQRRIGEIVTGKRAITADTGLRACRVSSVCRTASGSACKPNYDRETAKDALAETLAQIKLWRAGDAHAGGQA